MGNKLYPLVKEWYLCSMGVYIFLCLQKYLHLSLVVGSVSVSSGSGDEGGKGGNGDEEGQMGDVESEGEEVKPSVQSDEEQDVSCSVSEASVIQVRPE